MIQTASIMRLHGPAATPLSEVATASRQRDALYLLSEQLHAAETTDHVHEAAMDAIESALECGRSAILLFDAEGIMQFTASRGLSDEYRAAVTGHSPWHPGEINATPITIANVDHADLPPTLKANVLREGIGAVAFIPLVSDGALIGKFMAYFANPHEFTEDDIAVSLTIARQLANAIQKQRIKTRLQEREAELDEELNVTRMLQALSTELAHEADVDTLYMKLVNVARIIMRSDFASMQQYFPRLGVAGELKMIGHYNLSDEAQKLWAWVRADSNCTCGVALKRRERVIAADIANEEFMAGTWDQKMLLEVGIRAAQTTPLISRRGELVGMITTHWSAPHAPAERDLWQLDIVARLAADLIERNTQDGEQRLREERLRALTNLLSDVPWQARSDGAFGELQPAWENYTGQSWDAHAGYGWFEAIHPQDRGPVQAAWSAACFAGLPYSHPARLWHAGSHSYRHCLIRATPIRKEDGTVREWVGACVESELVPGGT